MDFSKMKLVTEMYAQQPGGGSGSLAGTKLTQSANNKASEAAQAPKKVTNTSNNIGMQRTQMSQKTGNVMSPNVQKPGGAPARANTTGSVQTTIESYFNALRSRKEYNRLTERAKSDWKTELKEALGADDEVFHPYVEVMPFKDFKQNEAKKNLAKQAMKPDAAENPAQGLAKAGLKAVAEGYKKRSESDNDNMNDKATEHDIAYRRSLYPDADELSLLSGTKFSDKGERISYEVADYRSDPTEYKKKKKAKEIENRARGYRKRKASEKSDK